MMRSTRLTCCLFLSIAMIGCGESNPDPLDFGDPGPVAHPDGKGSFRFGVATAATQIEDMNPNVDWYAWTQPEPDGVGKGTFIGDASMGFSKAIEDVDMVTDTNLDTYRFSVEWARVEPQRDNIDESALTHYGELIDTLVSRGVTPVITVHHFSSPIWVDDPRQPRSCPDGPTDTNLCGWAHPTGADLIIAELADHARLLAERYGDRVDDWMTVNEPVNYLLASYGLGMFPPGHSLFLADFPRFMTVMRNYIKAHVAIYDAIKAADTVDADGDGIAANVGFTLNVNEWVPARENILSDNPEDIAAVERVRYAYHYVFVESILQGKFDNNLDQNFTEDHPDWTGKLDWLGVQYYSRIGVSAERGILPGIDAMVCFGDYDLGSCVPALEDSHFVPSMNYEWAEEGVYNVLTDFATRWPDLPMTVSESGLATKVGKRRAEHVVRSLEQIHRAISDGADVRGYYHWSLMDNFEWAEGFEPRFGLYTVDFDTYERTPTEGADVLREIAGSREIRGLTRAIYGGTGVMTPEDHEE